MCLCVCPCVCVCVRVCDSVYVCVCVCVCYGQNLKYSDRWVIECFHFPPATTRHVRTNTFIVYTHIHTPTKRENRIEREWSASCCFLKDAAPACMLKLALNVWITHGSSHRGFSSHSLESGGCVGVSIYTHAHTSLRRRIKKYSFKDHKPISHKYHLIYSLL